MRALTVAPGIANSARVEDIPEPPRSDGAVLVRTLALGVCGTDREIVSGPYGWAPPGEKRLVIGHESLGEVCRRRRADSGFQPGDLRCRHRAPARSGAVPGLRRRRMGYVPQRPLHRARHQGTQRLWCGFFPHRAGLPGQDRSRRSAMPACWSSRPASSPRPGITPNASAGARGHGSRRRCWSPAPGPIGLLAALHRRAARPRRPCARPS